MKIKAIIWQEEDLWCASVPALPGCHTWGENYGHLLEILEDAVQGWLEVASDREEVSPEKRLVELSLCRVVSYKKRIVWTPDSFVDALLKL
jgi:predicted RNase H-like HicB family nuclease